MSVKQNRRRLVATITGLALLLVVVVVLLVLLAGVEDDDAVVVTSVSALIELAGPAGEVIE